MPVTPVLEVRNASFSYIPAKKVFRDVSFALEAGQIVSILGPNGAGKSSLLNCIVALSKLNQGDILVDGTNIADFSFQELAKRVGYVHQSQNHAFDFAVREYIVMGLSPYIGRFRTPTKNDYLKVEDVIERLGIQRLADKTMQRMSGGERQLVHIARAMIQRPSILVLDEPTNHLDFGNQIRILQVIVEHALDEGITVIMTTHMPDQAMLVGGKTAILNKSGTIEIGDSADIVTEARLKEIYDVDVHLVYLDHLQRKICVADTLRNAKETP